MLTGHGGLSVVFFSESCLEVCVRVDFLYSMNDVLGGLFAHSKPFIALCYLRKSYEFWHETFVQSVPIAEHSLHQFFSSVHCRLSCSIFFVFSWSSQEDIAHVISSFRKLGSRNQSIQQWPKTELIISKLRLKAWNIASLTLYYSRKPYTRARQAIFFRLMIHSNITISYQGEGCENPFAL